MYSITDWIERKLGLKVNATKTKITPPSKLKYLGFGFWKDKDEARSSHRLARVYQPSMSDEEREKNYNGWKEAVAHTLTK